MAKSDLGTKRICPTTGKKFYDLNKNPVISPYTGEVVPIAPVAPPRTRADAARAPRRSRGRLRGRSHAGGRRDRRIVSLEEADAEENSGKVEAVLPESEDDIEIDETLDDDDDDNSTFIADEEEGDEDVTDIIGDVGGDETRLEINPELCSGFFRASPKAGAESLRGHSSAGRALAWHARGRRFGPAWLHHTSLASRVTARQATARPSGAKQAKAAMA